MELTPGVLPKCILKALKKQGERTISVFQTQLYYHLQQEGGYENYVKRFNKLKTNVNRVDTIYSSLGKYNLLDDKFKQDVKSDDKATKYKDKGNKHFSEGKYGKALRCYTKTLMTAENKETIAIAYANRSAALFKLKLFSECLTDIDRALKNNYPDRLKNKLIQRRAKALELQKKSEFLPKFYEEIPKIPLHQRNPALNCASNCVEVKVSNDSKRHVFATRDIQIGEVIAVEAPFTATIGEQPLYHCHECFELCYNVIPCNNCTQAAYCSEECKSNAYIKYHKDECPILLSLRELVGRHKAFLLGIKMAFLKKDENADEVINLTENVSASKGVYNELFQTAMVAAFMYDLVKKFTKRFAGENGPYLEKMFKDSLLTYLNLSIIQATGVDELCPDSNDETQETVACAIYPFYGLLNHRCCPNVFAHHHGLKKVLRAIRTIKKGQECCVSYGPYYVENPKEERQNRLQYQYHIVCECRACREDWPQLGATAYNHLPTDDLMFACLIGNCNVELAKRTIPVKISQLKALEHLEPNAELSFQQKILLHCYDVLGNKRLVI